MVVTARDIDAWADHLECRSEFPRLIRRLIHAVTADITRIDIPASEGIQRKGFDGIVEAASGNAWIPPGLSVVEMGTDKNPASKAAEDYNVRSNNPLGTNPRDTTYIFVTPRNWEGKSRWVEARKGDGIWRDVRVYDAQDLEQWLELAPVVDAWLAEMVGKRLPGLQSLGGWWKGFSASTEPPMAASVILAGRDSVQERLHAWLQAEPSILELRADAPQEALAFFAAFIQQLSDPEREQWQSRALVVDDMNASRQLMGKNSLLLVLINADSASAGNLVRAGHRVFLPAGVEAMVSEGAISLPRPSKEALCQALISLGLAESRASTLAYECGRSILVLQRRLAVAPVLASPQWAQPEAAKVLTSALLVGGWSENIDRDRKVLEVLSGLTYPEFSKEVGRWLHISDPPFRKVGVIWRLTAPLDAWMLLGRFLTQDDFKRFAALIKDVFETSDPRFELPPEQRWAANVYGKSHPYSGWLRECLAESIVLLAVLGERANVPLTQRPQEWVSGIVRGLLHEAPDLRWASIEHYLPLFAEAAPDAFLEAVEVGLEGNAPPLMFLFQDEGSPGGCLHAGLLWALETIAWNPRYLPSVAALLGILSRLDPGGTWSNRPFASLKNIFLTWKHHTAANFDQKLAALDYLQRMEPDVSWNLMESLLPRHHDITMGTNKPRWRDWAHDIDPSVTVIEHHDYTLNLLERIFTNLGEGANRRISLLSDLSNLPEDFSNRFISDLESFVERLQDAKERLALWHALRRLLYHHRRFPDANWSLPGAELDRLEKVYLQLEPNNLVDRFSWLFEHGFPELPQGDFEDYHKNEELIAQVRREAVRDIHRLGGAASVLEIARKSGFSHVLGWLAAEVLNNKDMDSLVLDEALGSENEQLAAFARAYVSKRRDIEPVWLNQQLEMAKKEYWSTSKVVDLNLILPVTLETWKNLNDYGAQVVSEYWKKVSIWQFDESVETASFAMQKLLENGRPWCALDLVRRSKKLILPFSQVAEILERLFLELTKPDNQRKLESYQVEQTFLAMDAASDKDDQKIIQLEWQYLPILEDTKRGPMLLSQALFDDPAFFAEVVTWIYKPEHGARENEGLSVEILRNRGQLAYKLLHTWKRPRRPRSQNILKNSLMTWVQQARDRLKAADRQRMGDQEIGQMLARVPLDDDGIWPAICVREIVEQVRSRDLETGLYLGHINSRGITSRAPGEGGAQERKLEQRYRAWSEQVASTYPRTARVLREIADHYAGHAKREDEDAACDDLRYG